MVPATRRRFLSGAAAAFAALAGCNDSQEFSNPPESGRSENVERDPETHVLRAPSDEVVAWLPRERRDDTETTDADEAETPPERGRRRALVADAETAERLRFGEVEGVADAREFVESTDFESETVYFETHSVRECHELELCYVEWSPTEIDTQYGSYYRDAEVACDEDGEETTAWFIRVPDALDPDRISGHGSGWSSTGCRYPPDLRTTSEGTTTDEVVAHPVTADSTDGTANATAEGEE